MIETKTTDKKRNRKGIDDALLAVDVVIFREFGQDDAMYSTV